MENQLIKAEEYGLDPQKGQELTIGLEPIRLERNALIEEYKEVSKLELTEENLGKFKILRLKIAKNRTQGINKWHKTNKEFFLTGGRFVDAIKNKENAINEEMEAKLLKAEKHFETLEKERLEKIQNERVSLLSQYVEDAHLNNLSSMEPDVWEAYLSTKKKAHLERLEAERKAEEERQAKLEAERKEQERIRKENERLKAEAEEREKKIREEEEKRQAEEAKRIAKEKAERQKREEEARKELEKKEAQLRKEREEHEAKLKKEREAREKLEREAKEKKEAEEKALREAEEKRQAELNKGDAEKVNLLIEDLNALKTKYEFKSAKNKKTYKNVGGLLDKVINYINN